MSSKKQTISMKHDVSIWSKIDAVSLEGIIQFLEALKEQVPPEAIAEYSPDCGELTFNWRVEETEEQFQHRLKYEQGIAQIDRERKQKLFERLKLELGHE